MFEYRKNGVVVMSFDTIPNGGPWNVSGDISGWTEAQLNAVGIFNTQIEAQLKAFNAYMERFISGVGIGALTVGVMMQTEKALAFAMWSKQVAADYKSRIDSRSTNIDYSNNGNPPYSIWQIQVEIGL